MVTAVLRHLVLPCMLLTTTYTRRTFLNVHRISTDS